MHVSSTGSPRQVHDAAVPLGHGDRVRDSRVGCSPGHPVRYLPLLPHRRSPEPDGSESSPRGEPRRRCPWGLVRDRGRPCAVPWVRRCWAWNPERRHRWPPPHQGRRSVHVISRCLGADGRFAPLHGHLPYLPRPLHDAGRGALRHWRCGLPRPPLPTQQCRDLRRPHGPAASPSTVGSRLAGLHLVPTLPRPAICWTCLVEPTATPGPTTGGQARRECRRTRGSCVRRRTGWVRRQ
mmetsp:Transcript_20069/g.58697  ORF Transcript_20069/g.58697 Transcript_20069/m.58697 type:complete len:237 (+) Transcript_20069:278-988(+)